MTFLFHSRPGISFAVITGFLGSSVLADGGSRYSLYTDKKARRVEDVITVMVQESAKAMNDTQTETDEAQQSSMGINAGSGPLNFVPGMSVSGGASTNYDGKGKTSRAGSVKATVSARVIRVLDNGNLLIEGHKEVEVNQEKEILKVSGIIRPDDISPDNTVYSSKLADARIHYSGKGDASQASKQGWLARFWHWIL
jgi:flagellar L-ring protein precursor FlgH